MEMSKDRGLEDWLDFVVDTLKHLDEGAKEGFLQEFLLGLVSLDVPENQRITYWEGVLAHQRHLAKKLRRPVTLRTAAVDYFDELRILQNPVLMEYEELRRLRHNAATDPLTGLNNRRIFEEYLRREINRAGRYGSSFALLSIDLRRFKSVNDTYGHAAGDEILRSVARASLETIRASDITCRIGGDEFAILLPRAERFNAEVLAERIAKKFEEYAGAIAPKSSVGIDYGIAIFPQDGQDSASLFAAADKTLYTRKQRAHKLAAKGIHSRAALTLPFAEPTAEVETVAGSGEEHPSPLSSPPASPSTTEGEVLAADRGLRARKDERIRLEGIPALGLVWVGDKSWTARVLDLSRGGVCLLVDRTDLPESSPARLQVPLAPGGELALHRVYSLLLPEGRRRVGCSFTPISDQDSR
jgi:diguanylate cyclase (GGDEF)-like protein